MVTRLQVTYQSPEVDKELDKKILEFFNTLDFVCINREYSPILWRRLLGFEKQTPTSILESKDEFDARKSKETKDELPHMEKEVSKV